MSVKFLFFAFLCFFFFFETKAQEIFEKKFAPELLQEDFALLVGALEEAHPNLFLYQSQEDWKEQTDYLQEQLDEPLSEVAFYNLLKPLIAQIRDGNTSLMLSQYADLSMKEYIKFFPIDVYFDQEKVFVAYDYSEAQLAKGTEILEINGLKTNELVNKMLERSAADGFIKTASYWRFEQDLFSQELIFLMGSKENYQIAYRNKDRIERTQISAISYRKKTDLQQKNPPIIRTDMPFEFKIMDSVAYLRYDILGDFFNVKEKFIKFTKKSFEEIQQKNIGKLILDLRNNGGGEDNYGKMLYAHLTDTTFEYYKKQSITQEKYSFAKYTDDRMLNRSVSALRKKNEEDGTFRVSLDGLDKPQRPEREAFSGKIVVLINGGTFGVANEVAAVLKHNKRAIFVGQETGGASIFSSGLMPYLVLPNTALQLSLPLVRYEMAVESAEKGRGVMPDVELKNHEKDLFLEKALQILD